MVDLWRDFWIRETGTGQQVTQLHERYHDDDYDDDVNEDDDDGDDDESNSCLCAGHREIWLKQKALLSIA